MRRRFLPSWTRIVVSLFLVFGTQIPSVASARIPTPNDVSSTFCESHVSTCSEPVEPYTYDGTYIGHDEPSILFYSSTAGSGNTLNSTITLPKDPPTPPTYTGGGTDNFQLRPAFWFGMALCDTQSAPNFTSTCTPNSDSNIFDNTDPTAPDYMGNHPGGAFMELQFYPPGWVVWPAGNSCDATKWCVALNVDSDGENQNTGQINNTACLNSVGQETVNFAFVTLNGVAQAPANPMSLATNPVVTTPDPTKDLFMSSADRVNVDLRDTSAGFHVTLTDVTSGQTGSMTASTSNGFGQVKFDPTASTCTILPYAFHPMYSTASEHTRLTWTAHSYNTAFSDEIGHFELCRAVDSTGNCTAAAGADGSTVDVDDNYCFAPPNLPAGTKTVIGGCLGLFTNDLDFDGIPYQLDWPGTFGNATNDARVHAQPVRFTDPSINNRSARYDRIAFETDLPRVEVNDSTPCDRATGINCVNPPPGAAFYPFYTTVGTGSTCRWQLGGAHIPGTTNEFGGTSTAAFGPLIQLSYPQVAGVITHLEDFRQVLSSDPCA